MLLELSYSTAALFCCTLKSNLINSVFTIQDKVLMFESEGVSECSKGKVRSCRCHSEKHLNLVVSW